MTPPSAKVTKPTEGNHSPEPSPKRLIKVALVEDQPKVRTSWVNLINSFQELTCICACGSGEEALRTIPKEQPDVVLMDIFLPRMSGIECTVRLKALLPQTQILILTAMDDEELVFLALEAGADGYLLKRTKPADLRAALVNVLGGGAPMTSEIARLVIGSFRKKAKIQNELTRLWRQKDLADVVKELETTVCFCSSPQRRNREVRLFANNFSQIAGSLNERAVLLLKTDYNFNLKLSLPAKNGWSLFSPNEYNSYSCCGHRRCRCDWLFNFVPDRVRRGLRT